jgi:hypothetical protein
MLATQRATLSAWLASLKAADGPGIVETFEKLDLNGDSELSMHELHSLVSAVRL